MDSLPKDARSEKRRLRLLVGEGTHDQHTDGPHDRTRVERYSFPDIMHSMRVLNGLAFDTVSSARCKSRKSSLKYADR